MKQFAIKKNRPISNTVLESKHEIDRCMIRPYRIGISFPLTPDDTSK